MNILVVSDEAIIGTAWKYLLEERGHRPILLMTSQQATEVEDVIQDSIDFIFFDTDGKNGVGQDLGTIKHLHQQNPGVPILVLVPWSVNREEALKVGANTCISKPVDYSTVMRLIDMLLAKKKGDNNGK